jgi:hypothetical protein
MDAKKREGMARMDEIQRNMANIPRCYPIEISLFIDKDEMELHIYLIFQNIKVNNKNTMHKFTTC